MTIQEARNICDQFRRNNGCYTEEEFFLYTEAAGILIRETGDPDYMCELGAYYYREKYYELALKYYEMASELGDEAATVNLGYIWYYGRTGTVDHEKAFRYFTLAGYNAVAQYKIADMYHYGYYVKKDETKYREIMESLYKSYHGTYNVEDPLPEICLRLAEIRENDGEIEETITLLLEGKSMLGSRIGFNPFFGNFTIMQEIINALYRLIPIDKKNIDIFDLYELMKTPFRIGFTYQGETYIIESTKEADGTIAICYDGKWYRNVTDMLMKAEIDGVRLTLISWKLRLFEVE